MSGNLGRVSSTGGGEGGWKLPPKEIEDEPCLVYNRNRRLEALVTCFYALLCKATGFIKVEVKITMNLPGNPNRV